MAQGHAGQSLARAPLPFSAATRVRSGNVTSRSRDAAAKAPPRGRRVAAGGTWRLHVAACYRCLQQEQDQQRRQLIPRIHPAMLTRSSSGSSSRGLGPAAAVKDGPVAQQGAAAVEQGVKAERDQGAPPQAAQQQADQEEGEQKDSAGVRAALAMLRFYKGAISPLLPPACRFQPTCSIYSMEAFKKFGVGKGFVLTAWRLMRCAPWGNSGYDPVRWPPPGLEPLFPKDQ